jgi:hypothetical protein
LPIVLGVKKGIKKAIYVDMILSVTCQGGVMADMKWTDFFDKRVTPVGIHDKQTLPKVWKRSHYRQAFLRRLRASLACGSCVNAG